MGGTNGIAERTQDSGGDRTTTGPVDFSAPRDLVLVCLYSILRNLSGQHTFSIVFLSKSVQMCPGFGS